MSADLGRFIVGLPKAELHLHIEGTLEPEMLFAMAQRHRTPLAYATVEDLRAAYAFSNLQSFLDVYYLGAAVLCTEEDFFDLTWAYCQRAHEDGVVHVEIFFDPQTHTVRGIPMGVVVGGIVRALEQAQREWNMTSRLILCFLRHLSEEEAIQTLTEAMPYREHIAAVGLDSSERGHPPEKFTRVFDMARAAGFLTVAHAGEEGPPQYIRDAIDLLGVARIDHGVACEQDAALVASLAASQMPLTMCPLSNLKLRVVNDLSEHNLKRLLDAGLCVTVNSDDPAYFGGYVAENYRATAEALGLTSADLVKLAENSIRASFLSDAEKAAWLGRIAAYASETVLA